jgi:DNA (cytosine-5)-methyltransferase 1
MQEIIVDSFAGGGGASTGIEMALGRSPDIAINHDAVALAMHEANHPNTRHLPHNIWKVDPHAVCEGRPVGLLWASPDCKHFSKAKGGRPVEQNIRDLAWVVVRWARQVKPRIIILENVEEFADWGPLLLDGTPCPDRKGQTFKRFVRELRREAYTVEWRELVAVSHGFEDFSAPTQRKRLYMIARRDGRPIVWPKPTHGKPGTLPVLAGKLQPWRTAASIIDWSLPCPSIFATSAEIMNDYGLRAIRPLADATMARIAKGVRRYVIEAAEPFIIPVTHIGDTRTYSMREPVRTLTTAQRGEQALIQPFVTKFRKGHAGAAMDEPLCTVTANSFKKRPGGAAPIGLVVPVIVKNNFGDKPHYPVDEPTRTIVAGGSHHALVAAFLAQHNTDMVGHHPHEPVSTIVQKGCTQAVVSAGLVSMKGSDRRQSALGDPTPTQTAGGWHISEVRAFLTKYYGADDQDQSPRAPLHTATSKARFGLVTVHGEPYAIADIGMRMLTPRELFRAQGFPDTYIIDRTSDGTPITKTAQIRMCGNSVCPPVAAALVAANYAKQSIVDVEPETFELVAGAAS